MTADQRDTSSGAGISENSAVKTAQVALVAGAKETAAWRLQSNCTGSTLPWRPRSVWTAAASAADDHRHGRRDKAVSHLTVQQRGDRLYGCFAQLRELGYRLDDSRLGERYVHALVDHWIASGHRAATIQTKLSNPRVFAGWIGKPGMVECAPDCVLDTDAVKRIYAAQRDASWSARNTDAPSVIAQIRRLDPHVADQLLAELQFGLRTAS